MERDGVGEDGAYSDLRRFSIWNGTPLRQRAQDVVHSTQRPEPHLGAPPWEATMAEQTTDVLDRYRQDAELSHGELWLRYFELGA